MLYLNPNQANQTLYLTLQEAARDYLYTHYLFKLVNRTTGEDFYFVAVTDYDNERYTAVAIDTNVTNTNNVTLTDPGDYDYFVYAQTSSTNLDPANVAVAGLIERGTLRVPGPAIATFPTITLEDNVIYYEP